MAVDITQGTSFQIANTTGVTAETSFPSSGTAITIDGSAGGSTATQLSTFHSGAWTHYVTAISPAGLDALASGHVPATAAIQNPDTGSKFVLNGGISLFLEGSPLLEDVLKNGILGHFLRTSSPLL